MSYQICPSCGTEFGYTDFAVTQLDRLRIHQSLLAKWLRTGPRWHAKWLPQPADWNPRKQILENRIPKPAAAPLSSLRTIHVPMKTVREVTPVDAARNTAVTRKG
jgi:hypothetical protein